MPKYLLKRELTAASVIQMATNKDRIEQLKEIALEIADEYSSSIKIDICININPEKTIARLNITEYNI